MNRSSRECARQLYSLASLQGGYFTAKQAQGLGYCYSHLDYHVATGSFERTGHGIYRLSILPISTYDDFIRWSFWSRNREDVPQAIVSHASALVVHGLSDILPTQWHFIVPLNFRKPAPRNVVLHRAELKDDKVEKREGFLVTTPLRTLHDCAQGIISNEQWLLAVKQAKARGLIQSKERLKYNNGKAIREKMAV